MNFLNLAYQCVIVITEMWSFNSEVDSAVKHGVSEYWISSGCEWIVENRCNWVLSQDYYFVLQLDSESLAFVDFGFGTYSGETIVT